MKRRNFLQLIASLPILQYISKAAAEGIRGNTVYGGILDELALFADEGCYWEDPKYIYFPRNPVLYQYSLGPSVKAAMIKYSPEVAPSDSFEVVKIAHPASCRLPSKPVYYEVWCYEPQWEKGCPADHDGNQWTHLVNTELPRLLMRKEGTGLAYEFVGVCADGTRCQLPAFKA